MTTTQEARPMISIIDIQTGEEIVRPLNDEEYSNYLEIKTEQTKVENAKAKAEADKAAILARLGLTEDELKTILG
jgi:hypothetical protein